MKHIAKFNAGVAARIIATAGHEAGIPVNMIEKQIIDITNRLYLMGFVLCGDPASPQVNQVAAAYNVSFQGVQQVPTAPRQPPVPITQYNPQMPQPVLQAAPQLNPQLPNTMPGTPLPETLPAAPQWDNSAGAIAGDAPTM